MKKILFFFLFLFIFSCFSIIALTLQFFLYAHTPAGGFERKVVLIKSGDSFNKITSKLMTAGIINKVKPFKMLARIFSYDIRVMAGEYILYPAMSPLSVLEKLARGNVLLHKVTIPEGYNLKQIAEVVSIKFSISEEEFLSKTTDPEILQQIGLESNSLEGYLFPDTYFFPKTASCQLIITTMYKHFQMNFSKEWEKRAEELNLTTHEVVTLASIIEKETGQASERPIISSVFHNRLNKKMRLESDPTVIYGIKDYDGNITKKHLKTKTPYNTYVIKGLPPGPIANPGIKSIEAALYPSKSKFLYFVSKKDGTHYFSENLKQHTEAVIKYQKQ